MPTVSSPVGRSPKIKIAPKSVNSGLVARMGAPSESGRCFSAKYDPTHDAATMADFSSSCRCCFHVSASVTSECGSSPGRIACTSSRMNHTVAPVSVLKNNTGVTAFARTACLVQRA